MKEEMKHEAKVALFALFYIEELIDAKLLTGAKILTKKARSKVKYLQDKGEEPHIDEVKEVAATLISMR